MAPGTSRPEHLLDTPTQAAADITHSPRRGNRAFPVGTAPLTRLAIPLCLALAVGCGTAGPNPGAQDRPSASATAPATSPQTPESTTAAQIRLTGTYIGLADLFLDSSSAGEVPWEHRADGSVVMTFPPATPDGTGPATALLAAPSGGAFLIQTDQTVIVLGEDGTAIAGITPAPEIGLSVTERDLLAVVPPVSSLPGEDPTTQVSLWIADRAIASAGWSEREGGRSLAVVPTDWTRAGGEAARQLASMQLAAAEPEADTATMLDQLTCHMLGTPDKASWNLEPWRPDVGLLAVLTAQCNPV